MGRRMLTRLATQTRLQAVAVWDANPDAVASTLKTHPHLSAAASAEALVATPGLDSLYIATPPAPHMALSELGFDAGLAVFCEKPLTVDFDAARRCIARIEREGHRAAVNFALASSPGLSVLQTNFGAASHKPLGELREVQLELPSRSGHASGRRRPAPGSASGPKAASRAKCCRISSSCCSACCARSRSAPIASAIPKAAAAPRRPCGPNCTRTRCRSASTGRVGGDERPDYNRMRWCATRGEVELTGWFGQIEQRRLDGTQLVDDPEAVRLASQADQLRQWAAMIEGRSHSLPRLCGGTRGAADDRGDAQDLIPSCRSFGYTSTRSMPPLLAFFTYSGIQSLPRIWLAISTTM